MSTPRESIDILKKLSYLKFFGPATINPSFVRDKPDLSFKALIERASLTGASAPDGIYIIADIHDVGPVKYKYIPHTGSDAASQQLPVLEIQSPHTFKKEDKPHANIYIAKDSIFLETVLSVLIIADYLKYILSSFVQPVLETLDMKDPAGEEIIDLLHKFYNRVEGLLEIVSDAYSLDFTGAFFEDLDYRGLKRFPRYYNTAASADLGPKFLSRLEAITNTPGVYDYVAQRSFRELTSIIRDKIYSNFVEAGGARITEELNRLSRIYGGISDDPTVFPPVNPKDLNNLKDLLAYDVNVKRACAAWRGLHYCHYILDDLARVYDSNRYRKINNSCISRYIDRTDELKPLVYFANHEGTAPKNTVGDIRAIVDKYRKYGLLSETQVAAEARKSIEKTASPALLKFTKALSLDIPIENTDNAAIQPEIRRALKGVAQRVSVLAGIPLDGSPEDVVLKALRVSDEQDEIMLEVITGLQQCLSLAGYSDD